MQKETHIEQFNMIFTQIIYSFDVTNFNFFWTSSYFSLICTIYVSIFLYFKGFSWPPVPDIPFVIRLPTSYEELPRHGNHFKLLKHSLCIRYHRHKSYYLLFRPDYSTLRHLSTTGCCITGTIVETSLPYTLFFWH